MGAAGSKSSDPTAGDNALFNNFSGEEIRRLAKRFTKLDIDKSGWISFEEMMEWPEFKSNPLAKRIYAVMDKDSDGKVDLQATFIFVHLTQGLYLWNCPTTNAKGFSEIELLAKIS